MIASRSRFARSRCAQTSISLYTLPSPSPSPPRASKAVQVSTRDAVPAVSAPPSSRHRARSQLGYELPGYPQEVPSISHICSDLYLHKDGQRPIWWKQTPITDLGAHGKPQGDNRESSKPGQRNFRRGRRSRSRDQRYWRTNKKIFDSNDTMTVLINRYRRGLCNPISL